MRLTPDLGISPLSSVMCGLDPECTLIHSINTLEYCSVPGSFGESTGAAVGKALRKLVFQLGGQSVNKCVWCRW